MSTPLPAVVVVAHDKPRQLHRLIAALDPLPVFLHVDANTPDEVHRAMVNGLPDRVELLPRLRAGWARFEVLEAEVAGYRAALSATDAEHIVLLTGADYPLAPVSTICAELAALGGLSSGDMWSVPSPHWGVLGGYDRFWFRQRPWRQHRLALLVPPRRVPRGLEPHGGSQSKVLSRRHAQIVVGVWDSRPDLVHFFRRAWTPDEVFIPTVLNSPRFADWGTEAESGPHRWVIEWPPGRAKNPRWLGVDDLDLLRRARTREQSPAWFARKFAEDSDDLVALVDEQLRGGPG